MRAFLIVVLVTSLLLPVAAQASCRHGRPIDYNDITEVQLRSYGGLPSLSTVDGRIISGICDSGADVTAQKAQFSSLMCSFDGMLQRRHGAAHYRADEPPVTILQSLTAILAAANASQMSPRPVPWPSDTARPFQVTRYSVAFLRCGVRTALDVQLDRSAAHPLDADETRIVDLFIRLEKALSDHMHVFMVT